MSKNLYGYGIVDCEGNAHYSNCYEYESGAENICQQINKAYNQLAKQLKVDKYLPSAPFKVVPLYWDDED